MSSLTFCWLADIHTPIARPYQELVCESSLLNRIVQECGPEMVWGNKSVFTAYQLNAALGEL